MLVQVYVLSLSWLLAVIFAVAFKHKLTAWPRFKASFVAYRMVPEAITGVVAGCLAATEILTVAALLLWPVAGLLAGAGLLALYAAAIGVNVARGRTQIDCGCGDEPTPVSWTLVTRNVVLACAALSGFVLLPLGPLSWGVALVAFGTLVVAYGIYVGVEQLVANRGRYQRLWLGVS